MKTKFAIYSVLLTGLLLPLLLNCKKEAIKTAPTVTVSAATNITATTATSGGQVTADGGATVTASGVCWSVNQNPTTADNKTSSGSGIGSFTSSLTGLTPGTIYNLRAYAINSVGTGYSSQSSFTTPALAPVLTTTDLSAITATTATSGGNITNDGGSPVTARGVCWSKSQNPTIADTKTTDGTGTGSFTSAITGLTPGTTYYFRAYATNNIGTAYGNQVTVITTATLSTLATAVVSAITSTAATSGGNITSDGGAQITARGVCWSTSSNPTILNSKTTDGTGTGGYTSSITGLTPGATYYVRAYATNSIGTAYGNELTLTAAAILPVLTTGNISNITATSAVSSGNITTDGGSPVTARGVCWSTSSNPTILNSKTTDGAGTGGFISSITGITPGATYYVRAYATNGAGTAYGNERVFTAQVALITITASSITGTTAASGGIIPAGWGRSILLRGVCWSTTQNPTTANFRTFDGIGTGTFTSNLTNLQTGLTYYVRAYCVDSTDTSYGNQISFTSIQNVSVPTLTTATVSNIAQTTAISGGNITSDGGSAVTARGVCWATSPNPTTANFKTTDGASAGNFSSNLTMLAANTTYYVRAYATNSSGIGYGNEVSFKTTSSGSETVTDVDGNVYHTVAIGTQVWMVENLKTTKFNDGTAIPYDWDPYLSTPGYFGFRGDKEYESLYGAFYNWYTVNTGKLCPTGWHVPADAEWTVLTTYLGGEYVAGGKLKETGINHWVAPNTGATNESGFTAVPGGHFKNYTLSNNYTGENVWAGIAGSWWSSTAYSVDKAWYRALNSESIYVWRDASDKSIGNSVRCILGKLVLSSLTTTSISGTTNTSTISGGNIINDGGTPISARGVCWSTSSNPTISNSKTSDGAGIGAFTSNITGLSAGTTYYIRAYAINSAGTSYGSELSFTTIAYIPSLTTSSILSITSTTASSGGNISSDGGGVISSRGVCWATSSNPTTANFKTSDGTGTGSFTSSITGLSSNTTYYLRAYATNSAGTAYGNQISFTTTNTSGNGSISDVDGNTYPTITIGTQVWMASNLKTTKYNDGTAIPLVADNTTWTNLSTPGYCWYNNDASTNKSTYGALYNWYTVTTGKLCPTGWHVPAYAEWTVLVNYLGGQDVAGGKLKESGSIHWTAPNTGATNASGFTAVPGGYRFYNGTFFNLGNYGYWWWFSDSTSASELSYLSYDFNYVGIIGGERYGYSVRCLHD